MKPYWPVNSHWYTKKISVRVTGGDRLENVVQNSITAWNKKAKEYRLYLTSKKSGDVEVTRMQTDDSFYPSAAGYSVFGLVVKGEILTAKIVLNLDYEIPGKIPLVGLHEFGHVLGLPHDSNYVDDLDSVMWDIRHAPYPKKPSEINFSNVNNNFKGWGKTLDSYKEN